MQGYFLYGISVMYIFAGMKRSSYSYQIMDIGSNMKRCEICGRDFKSLGYARHMAMHRDKDLKMLEQLKKGRSGSMEASID